MTRNQRLAYYGLPLLFCLAVHWLALRTWFFKDDFAWLSLPLQLQTPRDLLDILFTPHAQGTVRVFSERLYFLIFASLFGLEAPPFRAWAFLTQFANLVLLIQIARRITGSALAGPLAAILWTANSALAIAMAWASAYNQIAFAFCLLLAFRLLLLHIDTGLPRYWIGQWIVFLLGFGVLELNVMYPVIAASYTFLFSRVHFGKALWLFVPSILFSATHFLFIPPSTGDTYRMYFDGSVLTTLWEYCRYTLSGMRAQKVDWRPIWLGLLLALSAGLALAAFTVRRALRRDWLPLFCLIWFLAVIAPFLVLKNHFIQYYACDASIGLAMLGAYGIVKARGRYAWPAVALLGFYLVMSVAEVRSAENYHYTLSRRLKYLITALEALPAAESRKTILLDGIDSDLFWTGMQDGVFKLLGIHRIYLTPGTERSIDSSWGQNWIEPFIIRPDIAARLLSRHEAVVFEMRVRKLHDVTDRHLPALTAVFLGSHPHVLDLADPLYQSRLGPEWYEPEKGFRWMPKTATFKIGGPDTAGQVLRAAGYCPAVALKQGPLGVTFRADGIALGTALLKSPNQLIDLRFPLPAALKGRKLMEVQIEVSRVIETASDPRPLGLIFQSFTIE